jgi:hypothetical protein
MQIFAHSVNETMNNNKLSSSEVINQINTITDSNLSGDDTINELNKILNEDFSHKIRGNALVISSNWQILDSKFDNIDEELLDNAFSYYISEKNQAIAKADCGWRFSLCVVAAGTGFILCHAGCDTTALALTAGLGIPACVAICGTLQVAASAQCYDSHCQDED